MVASTRATAAGSPSTAATTDSSSSSPTLVIADNSPSVTYRCAEGRQEHNTKQPAGMNAAPLIIAPTSTRIPGGNHRARPRASSGARDQAGPGRPEHGD